MSLGRKMMAVKRKPPRKTYRQLPTIPGDEFHDGPPSVAGTGAFEQKSPFARRGQAKTRPTPGSANNRRTARWN